MAEVCVCASQGMLKKLLSYTSVASHLRLHEEYVCKDGDILPETERSYPGSTPRMRGREDLDEKVCASASQGTVPLKLESSCREEF